jgi:DEAD/DEAH box helicase domain-containing protein
MDPEALLHHLPSLGLYAGQIVHVQRMPARAAIFGVPADDLAPSVHAALRSRGICADQLFSHQVEAIDALRRGEHVVVCTSTASGKSLCYNVPILQVGPAF